MVLFTKFVEIGRVVRVHAGPYRGHLGVIVDVIDQSRALVNGPTMKRHIASLRNLVLTPIVSKKVTKNARRATLVKALKADNVEAKFNALPGVQRQALYKKRLAMTDFERFKLRIARQKHNLKVRLQVNKLKNAGQPPKPKVKKLNAAERKAAKAAQIAEQKKKAEENKARKAANIAAAKAAKAAADAKPKEKKAKKAKPAAAEEK